MEVFQDYAYYYNLFYKDKDYGAEARIIDRLLKKYAGDVGRVINLGCGTGKHDIELAKLGYHCKGIDISPLMTDIAKENAAKQQNCRVIDFETADARDYETEAKYDAVISLFHVMSYQDSNEDIVNAFKTATKLLKNTAGIVVFDVRAGPGVLSDKPCVRVKEVEDENNRLIRIARPIMYDKENAADVNYEVPGQAGFELIDNIDCQTLRESNYNSWTSYFIAKAM